MGIFTERDVLRAVGSDFDAEHHAVTGFMTKDPSTRRRSMRTPTTPWPSMLAFGFRHLPVMDGGEAGGRGVHA